MTYVWEPLQNSGFGTDHEGVTAAPLCSQTGWVKFHDKKPKISTDAFICLYTLSNYNTGGRPREELSG